MIQQKIPMIQQIKNEQDKYINIKFSNPRKENLFKSVKYGTTVEELLYFYLNKVYYLNYQELDFFYNAKRIKRDDKTKVEKFFSGDSEIVVLERGF